MTTYTSEIFVHAPAWRVFDALTKPEFVARWQFGRVLQTTWEVGSEIRFRTEWDGGERVVEQWGTVREVLPGRVVEYDLFTPRQGCDDVAENHCVTRYGFATTARGRKSPSCTATTGRTPSSPNRWPTS